MALPVLKSAAKSAGKTILKTGAEFAGDILAGKSVKDAAKQRALQAGKTMGRDFLSAAAGTFSGTRRKSAHKKRKHSDPPPIRRPVKRRRTSKKRHSDVFDYAYKMIHIGSCECTKSELELFSVPPTLTSMEKSQVVEYLPLGALSDDNPLEFVVPGDENYVDLSKLLLYTEQKITKADGSDLDAGTKVGPINYLLHSQFSQVDLSLNGELVTSSNSTYPFLSYIQALLSFDEGAKKSHLQSSLRYADEAGKFDHVDPGQAQVNNGFKRRSAFAAESKVFDMIGRPHLDLCHQNRYLPNGVDMNFRFNRAKKSFSLMSDDGTQLLKITKALLLVRKVKLNPAVFDAHAKAFNSQTAKYPIRRTELKTFTILDGGRNVQRDNVFLGQLPRRVIIALVDNEAFVGAGKKYPFYFEHKNMSSISLEANGQSFPAQPLKTSFANNQTNYVRAYLTLFSEVGKFFDDSGNDITREAYKKGFALLAFDLTPDQEEGAHLNLVKEGNLRLDMTFSEALDVNISVLVYGEFDNVLEIDRARNIIKDFK
ncbi:uncharacterized protein F54H12.2-like [Lineus longissimus]|uniref:uncharacterized protein F54H12.2-like n=1 Tax=Lineus longissimus TaxID=88925 RepID=UPI00315D235D